MLSASFDQAKNVCVRNRNRPGGYHSSFLVCARGFQKNLKKILRTKKKTARLFIAGSFMKIAGSLIPLK